MKEEKIFGLNTFICLHPLTGEAKTGGVHCDYSIRGRNSWPNFASSVLMVPQGVKKTLDILERKCNDESVGCKKYLFGSQKVAKVLLKTFAIFF